MCVPARFAREGETVHRCRKSDRFDESEGESEWNAELRLKEGASSETFKDLRVYLICLATFLSSIPNGGISNFSSILLTTFGYSPPQAMILNTPSGAIGVFPVLLTGWLSNK